MGNWTLFSNHGHVLVCLVNDPESRLRDVALQVGITERAVQKIVRDLQDVGMLSVTKDGRRNRYRIDKSQPLRHELESHCTVADLIRFVQQASTPQGVETERATEPPAVAETEVDKPQEPAAELASTTEPEQQAPPIAREPSTQKRKEAKPEVDNLAEKQQGSLF